MNCPCCGRDNDPMDFMENSGPLYLNKEWLYNCPCGCKWWEIETYKFIDANIEILSKGDKDYE